MGRLRYRRSLELLAILAVGRRRWHARADIARLLWPNVDPAAARTNLRQLVSDLRNLFATFGLDEAFRATRNALRFDPIPGVSLDLAAFEAGCGEGESVPDWVERLYRGPLLDLADDSPDEGPFAEWLARRREGYRLEAIDRLASAADRFETAGDLASATRCAQTLADLAPVDEAAHRRLIRLLVRQGETARARRQYDTLRRRLDSEMDAEPDIETVTLIADMNRDPPADSGLKERRERRTLTCLCCEVLPDPAVDSDIDDETIAEDLEAANRLTTELIRRHDGRAETRPGQPTFGYFGFPVTREWATRLAARTAQAIIAACGAGLPIRIGICTDTFLVDLGRGLPDVLGDAANRARRLCSLGHPGDVIVDEASWQGLRHAFGGERLGEPSMSTDGNAAIWRLGAPRASVAWLARTRQPLVGRDDEYRQLEQRWRQTVDGRFGYVFLEGEAGIGKTRLIAELAGEVAMADGTRLRSLRCLPEQQDTPLAPIRRLFEELAGIHPPDPAPERHHKLARWIDRHWSTEAPENRERLIRLVATRGGDAETPPTEDENPLFTLLVDRVRALAADAPLLIVLEDAHWIDLTSRELLRQLTKRLVGTALPLMLVVTQRSGHPRPPMPEAARELSLGPLDVPASDRLLDRMDRHERVPERLRRKLARRCAGVPLFLEEMVRRHGRGKAGDALPANLLSLFQAEIDGLGSDRPVLLTASILGQGFTEGRLAAVVDGDGPQAALARLCDRDFLERHQSVFRFRHDLIREAAYSMLTRRRRRELHARLVEHLLNDDRSREEEPEVIARHLEAAGETGDAIRWWHHAGRLALHDQAVLDANRHFARALELADRQAPAPAQRLALALDASDGIIRVEGYGSLRARGLLQQALSLAEEEHDPAAEFRALTGLWFSDSCYDEQDHGVSTARRLLQVADDDRQRLTARFALGNSLFWVGAFAEAAEHLHAAAEMGDRLEGDQPLIVDRPSLMARAANCWTLWFLDRADEAEAVFAAGHRRAQALDEHYSTCYLLTFGANLYRCMGDADRVAELSDRILELARRHRFALWEGVGSLTRAWAAVHRGEPVSRASMRDAFATLQQAYPGGLVTFRAIIAETCLTLGDFTAAREEIEAALDEMGRTREIYYEPELHRLLAICLAEQGVADDRIAAHLDHAARRAEALRSPPLQRRVRTSLTQWRQGREARCRSEGRE